MCTKHRGIAVCLVAPGPRFDTAGEPAEGLKLALILLTAPPRDPLAQRWIGQDDVVLRKRRSLVGDLVGAHLREDIRELPRTAVAGDGGFRASGAGDLSQIDPFQAAGWTPLPRIS